MMPPPAPIANTDLAERLRLAVTRLARRLRQHGDTDLASPTQLSVLATLERRGPITLGELATAERVRPPTITGAIDRLEDLRLVARHTDEQDRRVVRVEITSSGRKLLARNRSSKTAYLAKQLQGLSPEDAATLHDAAVILDRLLEPDRAPGTQRSGSQGRERKR